MAENKELIQHLRASRNGTPVPALKIVSKSPQQAAIITKAVEDQYNRPTFDAKGNRTVSTPDVGFLRQKASRAAQSQEDSDNITATLPDIERIKSILCSGILSPHDLETKELTFDCDNKLFGSDLAAELKDRVTRYFNESYKIKENLYEIVEDMLFETGSHPIVVLPENAVDDLINANANYSQESFGMEALRAQDIINADGSFKATGALGKGVYESQLDNRGVKTGDVLTVNDLNRFSAEGLKDHRPSSAGADAYGHDAEKGWFKLGVSVTDNINALKMPHVVQAISKASMESLYSGKKSDAELLDELEQELAKTYESESTPRSDPAKNDSFAEFARRSIDYSNYSVESNMTTHTFGYKPNQESVNDRMVRSQIFKGRHTGNDVIRMVKGQTQMFRRSVGEPLIMSLPSEAVIPVCVPGNERKHVCYFVLLDNFGNPISRHNTESFQNAWGRANSNNNSFSSAMLNRVRSSIDGDFQCDSYGHQNTMIQTYKDMVEADLLARLRNGSYSYSVQLASNPEIYRIMLTRALAGNMTQVLCVPIEYMTYFASDFHSDGMGRSMLDQIRTLASIRAMVLFADVMRQIKNSIGHTNVTVTLDPEHPDPYALLERVRDFLVKGRQGTLPLGLNNPNDMVEHLAQMGFTLIPQGHPSVPEVGVQYDDSTSNHQEINSDLRDYLSNAMGLYFGVTPEMLAESNQTNFATTIVSNNLFLTKLVIQKQGPVNKNLTKHIRIVTKNSQPLYDDLLRIVERKFNDVILTEDMKKRIAQNPKAKNLVVTVSVNRFISSLTVELPKPLTLSREKQLEELEKAEAFIDKYIDSQFPEEGFDENLMGDIKENVALVRTLLKAYLMNREMGNMGITGELLGLSGDMGFSDDLRRAMDEGLSKNRIVGAEIVRAIAEGAEFKRKLDKAAEVLETTGSDSDSISSGGGGGGGDYGLTGDGGGDSAFPSLDGGPEDTTSPDEGGGDGTGGDSSNDMNIDW